MKARRKRRRNETVCYFGIDPGVSYLGLGQLTYVGGTLKEAHTQSFGKKKKKEPTDAVYELRKYLVDVVEHCKQRAYSVVEMPQVFSGSVGMAIAKKGDITNLAFSAGRYIQCLSEMGVSSVRATPMEWKGNVPDAVVQERVDQFIRENSETLVLCQRPQTEHEYDGLGMAIFLAGVHGKKGTMP